MASGSALGVDIISDSSISLSETDSDSDDNVRFSEFDSYEGNTLLYQSAGTHSQQRTFLPVPPPSEADSHCLTTMRSWGSVNRVTHLCLPGINRTDHGRTQSLISTIPTPDQRTVWESIV